jgi:hypothetical protein
LLARLMVAPPTALGVCSDVVAALDQAGLVLVGPKPHCTHHWNPEHLDNFKNNFFYIIDIQETPRHVQMS